MKQGGHMEAVHVSKGPATWCHDIHLSNASTRVASREVSQLATYALSLSPNASHPAS